MLKVTRGHTTAAATPVCSRSGHAAGAPALTWLIDHVSSHVDSAGLAGLADTPCQVPLPQMGSPTGGLRGHVTRARAHH